MNLKTAIIILNYNSYSYTIECLKSLLNQEFDNFTIFVVDNLSTNDSVEKIENYIVNTQYNYKVYDNLDKINQFYEEDLKIVFIKNDINSGYAAGNNLAIKLAYNTNKYQFYWVLNNDTIVFPNTLKVMIDAYNNDNFKRPVGTNIYYYDSPNELQMCAGLGIKKYSFKPYYCSNLKDVKYLSGASYLIDNDFIKKYGLMVEDYFLNSEDLDYFYQYYLDFKRDYPNEIPFSVSGKIYHKESATQGKRSPLSNYYYHRNLLYSNKKFHGLNFLVIIIYIIRSIKWLFIDIKMFKSIIIAIIDYHKKIKGNVKYDFMG